MYYYIIYIIDEITDYVYFISMLRRFVKVGGHVNYRRCCDILYNLWDPASDVTENYREEIEDFVSRIDKNEETFSTPVSDVCFF